MERILRARRPAVAAWMKKVHLKDIETLTTAAPEHIRAGRTAWVPLVSFLRQVDPRMARSFCRNLPGL